ACNSGPAPARLRGVRLAEVTDSFPGPVVPGRCGGVTVVMNCLHSPVGHVLQRRGDRPERRERGGGTATGSTISSVLPVRTEWLVSYGVIKFFCED
ncbi:hypothetical protein PO909_033284, partial [Leuciscus waleckii]